MCLSFRYLFWDGVSRESLHQKTETKKTTPVGSSHFNSLKPGAGANDVMPNFFDPCLSCMRNQWFQQGSAATVCDWLSFFHVRIPFRDTRVHMDTRAFRFQRETTRKTEAILVGCPEKRAARKTGHRPSIGPTLTKRPPVLVGLFQGNHKGNLHFALKKQGGPDIATFGLSVPLAQPKRREAPPRPKPDLRRRRPAQCCHHPRPTAPPV